MLELMVISSMPDQGGQQDAVIRDALGPALDVADRYSFNFAYVVDRHTMEPVASILEYLTFSASTRSNSSVTIKNKADSCYELFLYLDAIDVDYRDVCVETLIEYKERLSAYISPKTHRPLASGTVKLRLQVARDFCAFHGILMKVECGNIRAKPVAGRPAIPATSQVQALHVKSNIGLIEYVGAEDLKRLLSALGGPPGNGAGRRSRDWLLAVVCVSTGVRLSEALGLTVSQILSAEKDCGDGRVAMIRLEKTKKQYGRDKARNIAVDKDVISMLLKYIYGERKEAVAIGRRKGGSAADTGVLFVNGSDCAFRYAGRPYRAKRAEEFFSLVQHKIGLTRIATMYDLDTHRPVGERLVCKHTIHHLRHTYAIQAWNAYRSLPETDRWIRIQAQLGHKSHEITANTYLRAVKHLEGPARDMMGGYYKSLMAQA